jgi:hypothetical protein
MSGCTVIPAPEPLQSVEGEIYGNIWLLPGEEPLLKFRISKNPKLILGWVIKEEVGICVINDYAIQKLEAL